jgi:hypothetical protein
MPQSIATIFGLVAVLIDIVISLVMVQSGFSDLDNEPA